MRDCNNCECDMYCNRNDCIDEINDEREPQKDILMEIFEAWEETKEHFGIEGDLKIKDKKRD